MDFNLSEEQQMLADAVTRWLDTEYSFAQRRAYTNAGGAIVERNWQTLAELGLLGLRVPVEFGGMGASAVDTMIVMQGFGRALVLEPYVSSAVVSAGLIARCGSLAQKQLWLPRLVEGTARVAIAALEPDARYDLGSVRSTARLSTGGYRLSGHKAVVLHGDSAHGFIVSATIASGPQDGQFALFLVDAGLTGVKVVGFPTLEGQRCAEVTFENVTLPAEALLCEPATALESLEWGIDCGIAALCAEAVGAMERLMELTAEHLRSRKQFGQPIGRFQALQHRVADMMTAIEQARSGALLAAANANNADVTARRRAICAAKVLAGRSGRFVGQQAIQLHGGMGMTDELPVGYLFKRLVCIEMTWGNTEHHLERYGEQL